MHLTAPFFPYFALLRNRKIFNQVFFTGIFKNGASLFFLSFAPASTAMRRFCPSISELQAFEVTARNGSLTRAAQELCVTQGAVSKQLKSLETFLGVQLFTRTRYGLVLTDAGHVYLQKVERGLKLIEAASLELIASQGRGGTLKLTCMPTFGARWLIPRLPTFLKERPDIRLDFLPHQHGYDFSLPELDAAIRFGTGQWPGSVADYLAGNDMVPVCHPRIARQCHAPANLLGHPLLHHVTTLGEWTDWFEHSGISHPRTREGSRFDQYSLLTQAAIAGFGIALIPRCLVLDELHDGRLETAVTVHRTSARGYYLCYPESRASMPALKAFRAWLLTAAKT